MRMQLTPTLFVIALLALIPFTNPAGARAQELVAGQIINKVVCKADATQSYALYIPSQYEPSKKWPIIYCFDPAARGHLPVERYRAAAEKYGYIVAGSNNSRNGANILLTEIARTFLLDVSARLAIDEKQVYLSGFSGGARVAFGVGHLFAGVVAGVVACGAGFPSQIVPSRTTPFIVFATVGTEDFNYPEMHELDEALEKAGITHRLDIFEGGHDWAAPALMETAIEWLTLQAMQANRRPRDAALIDAMLAQRREQVRNLEAAGNGYQALAAYRLLAQDFKTLREVGEFEKRIAELQEAKEVKQAIKRDRDMQAEQKKRLSYIYQLRAQLRRPEEVAASRDLDAPTPSQSPESFNRAATVPGSELNAADERALRIGDLRNALNDLRQKSEAKENTPERALARRAFNQYLAYSFELTMVLFQTKRYELAVSHLNVETQIMPNDFRVFYQLARAYALTGEKKKALEALKKAIQKGFAGVEQLEKSADFESLRAESAYQKLITELRQKR